MRERERKENAAAAAVDAATSEESGFKIGSENDGSTFRQEEEGERERSGKKIY